MLVIALVAIVIGCVLFYLEVADYGPQPYQLGLSMPVEVDCPVTLARWDGLPRGCGLDLAECLNPVIHG